MKRTTVFIFHPSLAKSKTNAMLAEVAAQVVGVSVRHMDSIYPDGHIDIVSEQAVLEQTDHIVLQFPMYWYSGPAFMKKWLDEVLAYGWAYGSDQSPLAGKTLSMVVTLGGSKDEYRADGKAGHTVEEFLLPWVTTARYVGMQYEQTLVIDGALSEAMLIEESKRYQVMLKTM